MKFDIQFPLYSDSIPLLMARVSMGSIFISSGWGKLQSLGMVSSYFTELGIPFPEFNAGMVGVVELSGGILVLLGLLTRIAAIPLAATMAVAIMTAKSSDVGSILDFFGLEEFIYIIIFTWFMARGAGKASLDALVTRYCSTQS